MVRNKNYPLGNITVTSSAVIPGIWNFSTSSVDGNTLITINGQSFQAGNNTVFFSDGTTETPAYIKTENGSKIVAVIPPNLATGDYWVKVVTNSQMAVSGTKVSFTAPSTSNPIIYSVNKTTLKKGEKIIVTGKNLGATIGFMDNSGITHVRNVDSFSSNQVEFTIPSTFPVSTYTIYISSFAGGTTKYSNDFYNIVITN
jgi:hypothetical protein